MKIKSKQSVNVPSLNLTFKAGQVVDVPEYVAEQLLVNSNFEKVEKKVGVYKDRQMLSANKKQK
jgi:hypothetical protein